MMLNDVLTKKYGLTNVVLTDAPRGFIAETFYVDSDSGRHFAKIIKTSRDSDILEQSLPVLRELHQLGIDHIIYPILTRDGQLSVALDGKILALFNCVEGEWRFDFPFEPYVHLLGEIHTISDRIQTPLAREIFDSPYQDALWDGLNRLWAGTFTHPHEKALQDWALTHRAEIERDFPLMEQAAAILRAREPDFVLTHGDAAGNVIVNGDQVSIVDWDMVLFAPRERDTWFHFDDPRFLPQYQQIVPGYTIEPVAYRFYLYKRYFEDIVGYVEKILSPDSTDAVKQQNLKEHYQTCDEWLRPLMDAERTSH